MNYFSEYKHFLESIYMGDHELIIDFDVSGSGDNPKGFTKTDSPIGQPGFKTPVKATGKEDWEWEKYPFDDELVFRVPLFKRSPHKMDVTFHYVLKLTPGSRKALADLGFWQRGNVLKSNPHHIFLNIIKGGTKYSNVPGKSFITDVFIEDLIDKTAKLVANWYNSQVAQTDPYKTITGPDVIITPQSSPMTFPPSFSGESLVDHWAKKVKEYLPRKVHLKANKVKGEIQASRTLTGDQYLILGGLQKDYENVSFDPSKLTTGHSQEVVQRVGRKFQKMKDENRFQIKNVDPDLRYLIQNYLKIDSSKIPQDFDWTNRTVLVLDDNAASGLTFSWAKKALEALGAKRVDCLAMFDTEIQGGEMFRPSEEMLYYYLVHEKGIKEPTAEDKQQAIKDWEMANRQKLEKSKAAQRARS